MLSVAARNSLDFLGPLWIFDLPCGSADRSVGLSLCGTGQAAVVCAHNSVMLQQTFSCYFHMHGNYFMARDTGHLMGAPNVALRTNAFYQL